MTHYDFYEEGNPLNYSSEEKRHVLKTHDTSHPMARYGARLINLDRQLNSVREKYMSNVVRKQFNEGDILLAYPSHIGAILEILKP